VTIAGVGVSIHRIIIFVAAILVAIGLRLFLYNTRTGIAMRAVVDDRSFAQLNGARPGLTSMASWGLGAGLAALWPGCSAHRSARWRRSPSRCWCSTPTPPR
jgi:branched-chain amino acid transport system permease protein